MQKILIEYDETKGNLQLKYPKDKILAYGMLQMAKDAILIASLNQKQEDKPLIEVPEFIPPGLDKR